MTCCEPIRLLIIPGLRDSGPGHWQTWLQRQSRHAVRVRQLDWQTPDLGSWSARIDATLASRPGQQWIAVAHSFGCLALADHLWRCAMEDVEASRGVRAALFVAPADPERFRIADALPRAHLRVPSRMLASDTDPWMEAESARRWASFWGSRFTTLGDAGHINVDSGFGPLPVAKTIVEELSRRLTRHRRAARQAHDALVAPLL